jgi:lysozyme family protein
MTPTPDQRFAACFAITETYEGWHQFSNDPYDPGGATYSGVTQRAYDSYRRLLKLPLQGVRRMGDDECRAIYRTQYWDAVRGDDLFAGLDLFMYDTGVNSGPITAIKFLQQALGVAADGQIGLETMGALAKVTDRAALIQTLCARRLSYWHALTTWWRYGRGWTARGTGIDVKALAMLKAV